MSGYVLAIDQGTTSTRAIVFDATGAPCGSAQLEHAQITEAPGWVAHDATEIWRNTLAVINGAVAAAGVDGAAVAAVGIANQRETTVIWDRNTGEPVGHAIVWQDTRSQAIVDALAADGGVRRFADVTGLPLATYFSASKIGWVLEHVAGARPAAEAGDLAFGTIDTWLLWNLTGGPSGGVHATDVTNASRTLLMDLGTLDWAEEPCVAFGVPKAILPRIRPSSSEFGVVTVECAIRGVPVTGMLGDQQAAAFGQACFSVGDTKSTYGTGSFLLVNTGTEQVRSEHGLVTTVAHQLADAPATYALEGSIAVTGSLVQWLRDNLGLVESSADVEALALSVPDNGDVYIVPAFSGLFAPHWRPDARGAILGLTRFANKGHLARAALESTAFQTLDVLRAIEADTGHAVGELKVDGGMVANETLMGFQADVLGAPVIRPQIAETTALGAAYAAGLARGVWRDTAELRSFWREDGRWEPRMAVAERERLLRRWRLAVTKSMDWAAVG